MHIHRRADRPGGCRVLRGRYERRGCHAKGGRDAACYAKCSDFRSRGTGTRPKHQRPGRLGSSWTALHSQRPISAKSARLTVLPA
jgi:hypothetical protein